MRNKKTAYELKRSQVATPEDVIKIFWATTHRYRRRFSRVLDLGAGDGRFAFGGKYERYEGIEIDQKKRSVGRLPPRSVIHHGCAFDFGNSGYSACVGNPPYVRHHDLDEDWRDTIAAKLSLLTGESINRKCNLYVYFLFLALLKSRHDGLVSMLVPYEWVSRPSSYPLRQFIQKNRWHVDIFRLYQPVFDEVLTTASISIIDKKNKDNQWRYFGMDRSGVSTELKQITGSDLKILQYQDRGVIWAMRGMSPGTQNVFTLSEGERIHAGLKLDDVLPCVTSLRGVPNDLSVLNKEAFRKRFVEEGAKCWLIKSYNADISPRLRLYLDSVPELLRNTWTCNSQYPWYRFSISKSPNLLVGTGFTAFGPKVLINSIGAHAVGSVCGIYSDRDVSWSKLQDRLRSFDFEKRVVPHANQLKKIEIRQLNSVLNYFWQENISYD